MNSALRRRPQTSAPTDGSRTVTIFDNGVSEGDTPASDDGEGSSTPGVLKLRGGPKSRPQVAWKEDVIDNEGIGKKKSKICCIYHKPKQFDESSDESDSDDSDCDGRARPLHSHNHHHPPQPGAGGANMRDGGSGGVAELQLEPSPNAYERKPKPKDDKGKGRS